MSLVENGGDCGALEANPLTFRRAVKTGLSLRCRFPESPWLLWLLYAAPQFQLLFKCIVSRTSFGLRLGFESQLGPKEDKNSTYTLLNV